MRIYSLKSTYMIVVGFLLLHGLVFGLCWFWINKFLIESYDPTVYILFAMLLVPLAYCDFGLSQLQIYQRCFYKVKLNEEGFICYDLFGVHSKVSWNEVHTYGVTGYDRPNQPIAFVFFSKNPNEANTTKQKIQINKQRVVIEIREKSMVALSTSLPSDMNNRILRAIEIRTDCFYRK